MNAGVQVVSQADFETWLAGQTALANDPVARGEKLYQQYGCQACHTTDGSKLVGPSFLDAYGRSVELEDGSTITADELYFYTSIADPNAQVVAGFPAGAMPQNFAEQLSEAQINDIVAFIKSLSDQ
jgi:cytochrome c oxidase subunit 2